MSAAQHTPGPLSALQIQCLDWARRHPDGFGYIAYRSAGFTVGTVGSLVARGLLTYRRDDATGRHTWRAAIAKATGQKGGAA